MKTDSGLVFWLSRSAFVGRAKFVATPNFELPEAEVMTASGTKRGLFEANTKTAAGSMTRCTRSARDDNGGFNNSDFPKRVN